MDVHSDDNDSSSDDNVSRSSCELNSEGNNLSGSSTTERGNYCSLYILLMTMPA